MLILIVTFIVAFFVNIPALFQTCSWRTCPDFVGPRIISFHPNFYPAEVCGGIAGKCYPPSFSLEMLMFDLVLYIILNILILSIFRKFKTSS